MVGLDEAHAAHVGGQVERVVAAGHDLLAVLEQAQVHEVELVAELILLGEGWVGGGGMGEWRVAVVRWVGGGSVGLG